MEEGHEVWYVSQRLQEEGEEEEEEEELSRYTFALSAIHAESTPASTEIPANSIDTLGHGVATRV